MRIAVLGSPRAVPDVWHDDLVDDACRLGWDIVYLRLAGMPSMDVVQRVRGCQAVIWCYMRGNAPSGDAHAMLRRIEDSGAITVGIHLDLHWGIAGRQERIGHEAWWSCQHVFTADGGSRDWLSRDVNHHWCPPAVGSRHLGRIEPRGRHRVVFVGSCSRSVHGPHRAQLLAWAGSRWGREFGWYGATPSSRLFGVVLGAALSRAELVLGDCAPADNYWSDRVPRTLARGGVLAHPKVLGMSEQGLDQTVLLLFDRGNFNQIDSGNNLLDPAGRELMREAGIELVESRHTWLRRLPEILRTSEVTV